MTRDRNFYRKLAIEAARIADSKKAENIDIYEAGAKNSLFYYILLASAESAAQISAIEQEILFRLKSKGAYSRHKDGIYSKNWKVLDYGGFIIHIFEPKTREFYSLDRMYLNCKKVDWRVKETKKSAAAENTTAMARKNLAKKKTVKKIFKPAKKR